MKRMFNGPPAEMPDGVVLIDKPAGLTSHDVVDRIRRRFRIRKVGHGGSLDPQATGLLVVLLGKGTRLSDRFLNSDKEYEGVMRLGVTTDSYDLDGTVQSEAPWQGVSREQVEAVMRRFQGDLMQTPPMISAVKKGGVPLYKLARKGQEVEREARLVHLYEFTLLSFSPPDVGFRLRCTKGTYVRSLCHDVGQALGCGAVLASLRRTASGAFRVEDAIRLDEALDLVPEDFSARIIPPARILMLT
jgi:tRNA pseudouridine55 synthase